MEPTEPPDPEVLFEEAAAALGGTSPGGGPSLSDSEVAIVRALGEALIPRETRERTGGLESDTGALLADYARGWPGEYRLVLRASLRFVEWAPIVFQIKPRAATLPLTTFTAMDVEDRERVVRRLDEAHSYHARMLFKVAKTLVHAVYYGQPHVSAALGYDAARNKEAAEAWARAREARP